MADDKATGSGSALRGSTPVVLSVGGVVAFVTGAFTFAQTIPTKEEVSAALNQGSIALEVARSHGDELELIRQNIAGLRSELVSRTEERFRESDWNREEKRINGELKRLSREIESARKRLEELCVKPHSRSSP